MVFEAQIILRRDNAQQLMDDYAAVSAFLEQRKVARNAQPLDAVMAAERILNDPSDGRTYAH